MELRRLSKSEQVDLLRLLVGEVLPGVLQEHTVVDYLRGHFLAENADQNRKGAALVLVRSIAEQSDDPVIRTTASAAVDLLEGRLGAQATVTEASGLAEEGEGGP